MELGKRIWDKMLMGKGNMERNDDGDQDDIGRNDDGDQDDME